ncbi:MAG: DUF3883 domain-containing protein [Nitrospira sp.]|nr:DUF3883 domain-containing protein [Nitrospira sp.]
MAKDSNAWKAARAIEYVEAYERKKGRRVKRGRWGCGYDLTSRGRRGAIRRIEVKGSRKPKLVIPDLASSEFTKTKRLKATHLYVVANLHRKPTLYVISRSRLAHVTRVKGLKQLRRWRVPESAQRLLRDDIHGEVL